MHVQNVPLESSEFHGSALAWLQVSNGKNLFVMFAYFIYVFSLQLWRCCGSVYGSICLRGYDAQFEGSPPTYRVENTSSTVHLALFSYCSAFWLTAEAFHNYYPVTAPTVGLTRSLPVTAPWHNRWCHIHSLIEPDWSDNFAVSRTLICDYDPFEPPFDVFDSWNSCTDSVNADTALSPDICSHADTSNTDV
eukprot:g42660.t1